MKKTIAALLMLMSVSASAESRMFMLRTNTLRDAGSYSIKASMVEAGSIGRHVLNMDEFDVVLSAKDQVRPDDFLASANQLNLVKKLAETNKVKINNCNSEAGEIVCFGSINSP